MAVTQITTSATDKLFLEYILKGLNYQLRENTVLYDRFDTVDTLGLGKYIVIKALSARPTSARPSSSSTFPTAVSGTYDEFILRMKRGMYAQLQFDGLALACGKGDGAVMDLLKSESKAIVSYIGNRLNKQFWGDGSGRLANLENAISASTTIEFESFRHGVSTDDYTDPLEYLDENQVIDIYDPSGNLEGEELTLTSLTDDGDGTGSATLSSAVTATDDGFVFDHDTYATSNAAGTGVPMGLRGIVDTANETIGITATSLFQNINRSASSWAQAQVQNHASAAPTDVMLLKAVHDAEKYGRVDVIITNSIIWRALYEVLVQDRSLPNAKAVWGGLTGIDYYGGRKGAIPIIHDTDCPDQDIYVLDSSHLKVYAPSKNGMKWLPGDNGILTRVQGKDEYTASLLWYYNFGTDKPMALLRISNVKHASS